MTIDNNITVNISLGAAPVGRAGFGVTLCAGPATFAERVRYYSSASEAAADSALMTAAQLLAVQTIFAGNQKPDRVAVGRVTLTTTAQVITFTVGGGTDGDYTITINGTDYTHSASGETADQIATALRALVDADPAVSTSGATSAVIVTADVPGTAFTYAASSTGDAIAVAVTTANATPATDLDAVLAEQTDWYGLVIDARDEDTIYQVAQWTESNERLFIAQSSDAGLLDIATTTDIASRIQDESLARSLVTYYSDDTKRADASWMGGKLAADPDVVSTDWAYYTLVGIPVDAINSTQRAALEDKGASFYTTFRGVGATWQGKTANGFFIDTRISADWIKARVEEDFSQILLDASNNNTKVPYTNGGIQTFVTALQRRLDQGERESVGHFVPDSSSIDFPLLKDVSAADRTARQLNMSFETEPAGSIQKATITGNISITV